MSRSFFCCYLGDFLKEFREIKREFVEIGEMFEKAVFDL